MSKKDVLPFRPHTYFQRVALAAVPRPVDPERPNLIVEPPSTKTEPYSVRPGALHGPERRTT